ncbi:FecCD family ABC transporter permease [Kitasatospora sp. NPDC094019]|uniref:FecCD family ABC transporter permease n=1 Tax=Kitasatospora sp. NPDC094019 TaxID=3364091 RepID=UPI00380407D8
MTESPSRGDITVVPGPAEVSAGPGPRPVPTTGHGPSPWRRLPALALAAALLTLVVVLSIGVGARWFPPGEVWRVLLHPDGTEVSAVVHDLRVPRTLLGLLIGSALGVAGTLMQAVTRNPLADPGLLGVNSGSSLAMVIGFTAVGTDSITGQLGWSFGGAVLAAVAVYAVGSQRTTGTTPIRLVLAGAAVSAALLAVVQGMILLDPIALDRFRYWAVGALAGRDLGVTGAVTVPVLAGLLCAVALGRSLNAFALGEDSAHALGARPGLVRAGALVSITLLCGAATAAAGPVSFLGLVVPHLARRFAGADQRWGVAWALVLGPLLFLGSDVIGRVIDRPAEIQVGVVCAFLGAPVLIALTRGSKAVSA